MLASVVVALTGASAVPAQDASTRGFATAGQVVMPCDSALLRTGRGSREDTLRVLLRRANGGSRLDAQYAMDALDALRRNFRVPERMAFPFHVPLDDSSSTVGVVAGMEFVALRDGSVRAARLTRTSLVPSLDEAAIRALHSSGAESAFAPFGAGELGDELPLVLEVAFGLEDSTRTGIDAALITLPRYGPLTPPQVVEPQRLPRFANARAAGSQLGRVTMSFGVSERGRVVPGTVEFSTVTTRTLARAVLEVLPDWRFVPASVHGCLVPALVTQSFTFTFPP